MATKKSISNTVKNSWESKKPVKKLSKTPKQTKESVKKENTVENGGEIKVLPPKNDNQEVRHIKTKAGGMQRSIVIDKPKGLFPNPYGTPTKYKKEFAQMLIDFFYKHVQQVYVDREYYDQYGYHDFVDRHERGGDGLYRGRVKSETHRVVSNIFPTLERFASEIWVHRDTLRNWANDRYADNYEIVKKRGQLKNPEFFSAYALATQMQEALLIEWAMDGRFNSQFAIFLAKNRFGYKDKTEVESTLLGAIGVAGLDEVKSKALLAYISEKRQKKEP